jgi:hypothetical protein
MSIFRPHILKAVISTPSYEDPKTGQIIQGTETAIEFPCRVSPNGGGKETRDKDGNSVVYAYLIHADKNVPVIPFGVTVTVLEGEKEKAKGKVIGAFGNGKNMRIWI